MGWIQQRRGAVAGTRTKDALGSSGGHIVREQPACCLSQRGPGGVGAELGPRLSWVLARPCHSRLQERGKGAGIERLDGEGHAGGSRLCAPEAAGAVGAAGLLLRGTSLLPCAPGRRESGAPLRLLLLRLLLRLRLPLLKEDSAQPNSSLIIPARISLLRKHSLKSRTHSLPLSQTR